MKMKKIMRSTFGRLLCKNWVLAATLLVCGTGSLYAQTEGNTIRALPKVSIDNLKEAINADNPVEATITMTYPDETPGGTREVSYRCLVKYRGGTSISFDKKSMKIAFLQDQGDGERDVELPGLGRSDDKCNLDAAAVDRSHFRNRLAMDLFNSYSPLPYPTAFDGRHGISGNYVEVWTEGRYSGLYCLTDRVNRKLLGGKKMKDGEVRGVVYKCSSYDIGCFFYSDGTEPAEGNASWNAWEVKYPNEYPSYVFNPLRQAMDASWDTVPDEAYNDLVRQYFYWDNLVDVYLLSIVAGLADMGYKNSYLSCPDYTKDQRFIITPWDMDHSFGESYRGVPLMDLSTLKGQTNWINTRPFKRLMANTESGFLTSLADRWAALRDGPLSVESVTQRIYDYADLFDKSGAWQREREEWNYNPVTLWTTARDGAAYLAEWYQANHALLDELLLPHQSTDIKGIVDLPLNTDHPTYDLQGRKVQSSVKKKGIYIHDNKKILTK